jgi:hypothetical protein
MMIFGKETPANFPASPSGPANGAEFFSGAARSPATASAVLHLNADACRCRDHERRVCEGAGAVISASRGAVGEKADRNATAN